MKEQKITYYNILTADNVIDLIQQVQTSIDMGWQPVGPFVADHSMVVRSYKQTMFFYGQARPNKPDSK